MINQRFFVYGFYLLQLINRELYDKLLIIRKEVFYLIELIISIYYSFKFFINIAVICCKIFKFIKNIFSCYLIVKTFYYFLIFLFKIKKLMSIIINLFLHQFDYFVQIWHNFSKYKKTIKQDNIKIQNQHQKLIKKYVPIERKIKLHYTETQLKILCKWFLSNLQDPFPNDNTKLILSSETNLKIEQINSWFKYTRQKMRNNNEKTLRNLKSKFNEIPNLNV